MTSKKMKVKVFQKMAKPLVCDDGLYPSSILVESMNWQRATLEDVSIKIFKLVFWNHLLSSQKVVIKKQGYAVWRAYFFCLATFSTFCDACFGQKFLKFSETNGQSSSTIFVCPYGLIKETISETSHPQYAQIYEAKGWSLALVNADINTGKLTCRYRNLSPQFCFVLEELSATLNGKMVLFYKVLVPDENRDLVVLMPGVKFPGTIGVIPATCMIQRTCRIPFLQFKAHPNTLNRVLFAFRAFQVVNNSLQWKTRPLSTLEEDGPVDEAIAFEIPPGYSVFTNAMTEEFLDAGYLSGLFVMFKLYEDEWKLMKVTHFFPEHERGEQQYNYEAKLVRGRGKLPIHFQLGRYNPAATAEANLGTWFMVQKL